MKFETEALQVSLLDFAISASDSLHEGEARSSIALCLGSMMAASTAWLPPATLGMRPVFGMLLQVHHSHIGVKILNISILGRVTASNTCALLDAGRIEMASVTTLSA